jgi:perosamine synthetase
MIPVFRPCYDDREVAAMRETLLSGWVGLGPRTAEFEKRFASFIGVPCAVGLNSATAALHLAMHVAAVKGREVITSPMTFVSTNHAILYEGGTPVFCDVEEDTMNMDVRRAEALITPKTAALICVHYGGRSCDMDRLLDLCGSRGIMLIEDCAHGAGGRYKDRPLGSMGAMGCFSFHAVKNIATADGGMVTTSDPSMDARLRRLRWLGISADTFARGRREYSWQYDVVELGFKCHMNDIMATLGLVQLGKIDAMNDRRRALTAAYDRELAGVGDLRPLAHRDYQFNAAHNYVVRTDSRDALNSYLKDLDISTGVHYYPNHMYDMYREYYRPCPVAEREWKRLLTLPLYPDLKDDEQAMVIGSIRKFFAGKARSKV